MRYSSYINNQRCLEWGLNANQGALFDLLNQAVSWAKEIIIDGTVYYWVSRNEVIKELPLFYSKPDTVYRHFVDLNKKGLIDYKKLDGKDLIRLTPKGKTWNEFSQPEIRNNSDLNPTLGNKSEQTRIEIRNNSDLNPTNNITNYNNTKDHNTPLPPKGESANAEDKKSKNRLAEKIDYQSIADAYNNINEEMGEILPMVVKVNDERKRKIKKFLGELKSPTLACAENYFRCFFGELREFHQGENDRGWKANFDYAIRPDIVLKVREECL